LIVVAAVRVMLIYSADDHPYSRYANNTRMRGIMH